MKLHPIHRHRRILRLLEDQASDALVSAAETWLTDRANQDHAWGRMYCPYNDEECRCGEFCITSIWSTPKNPSNHARALRRVVDNCTSHRQRREADDGAKE